MPYRQQESINNFEHLIAEMRTAIQLLRQWSKYEPVIAGGALWSWAAHQPARDFDIFVYKTWFSRAKAVSTYQAYETSEFVQSLSNNDGYSLTVNTREVLRFAGKHADTQKPVDLILTPWKGLEVLSHFDYDHCKVGFGLKQYSVYGAESYALAALRPTFEQGRRHRDRSLVGRKVQESLWGKPWAVERMEEVMATLSELLAEPMA